jgi:hypothetical protein
MAKRAIETVGGDLLDVPGAAVVTQDDGPQAGGFVVAAEQLSTKEDVELLGSLVEEAIKDLPDKRYLNVNQLRLDNGLPVPRRAYRVSVSNADAFVPLTVVAVDESEAIQRALVRWGVTGTTVSTLNFRVDLAP